MNRPKLPHCSHTVEQGWEIHPCHAHEAIGDENFNVCEWHTYHNRKGGYDSKSEIPRLCPIGRLHQARAKFESPAGLTSLTLWLISVTVLGYAD